MDGFGQNWTGLDRSAHIIERVWTEVVTDSAAGTGEMGGGVGRRGHRQVTAGTGEMGGGVSRRGHRQVTAGNGRVWTEKETSICTAWIGLVEVDGSEAR